MKKYYIKNIDDQTYSSDYETLEKSLLFRIGFFLKYRYILPVFKKIQKDKAIIDIGCAHGVFLNYLLKKGFCCLFGMDLKNKLSGNIASSTQVTFIEQSFLHPNVPKEGPFDVLHISGMLHHLQPNELRSVPKIMANMLTESGFIFIYEPNRFSRIGVFFYEYVLPLFLPLLHRLSEDERLVQHAFCLEMPAFMAELKNYFEILSYSERWFYYSIIGMKR
jgi:2-polyprenyl-3-methyl-5-hydroxy-6-metoxy-1,4-benzoquinol methylase